MTKTSKTLRAPDAPGYTPGAAKGRILRARDVDLVPFLEKDVDETYRSWLLDDEVVEFLEVRQMDRSMPALNTYVRGCIDDPNRYFYLIVDRASSRRIGTASLAVDPLHLTASFGYLIGERRFWGTGAALQAQVALFDLAFDEFGVRRFYGGAFRENVKSQFNLKRLGFKKEGVFRQHLRTGAEGESFTDLVYYGLMADEWRAIRGRFDELRYAGDERG